MYEVVLKALQELKSDLRSGGTKYRNKTADIALQYLADKGSLGNHIENRSKLKTEIERLYKTDDPDRSTDVAIMLDITYTQLKYKQNAPKAIRVKMEHVRESNNQYKLI